MKLQLQTRPFAPRAGQTLLEVAIAATCLTLLVGAVGFATKRGSDAANAGVSSSIVASQAQRLVDRIASEFLDAARTSLPTPPATQRSSSVIEFSRSEGYAGGAIVLGNQRRFARVESPSDPDDGIDNDADGMIDEGSVVLIPDTAASPLETIEIASGVPEVLAGEIASNNVDDNGNGVIDESGLSFEWDNTGTMVTIRASIQRRGIDGQIVTRTAQTTVLLRN